MKKYHLVLLILVLAVSLSAQTKYLGDGVYVNTEKEIDILVDTGMAAKYIEEDYIMFMVGMLMEKNNTATIDRKSLYVVFNDQEIFMPDIKDFRENYRSDTRDLRMFRQTIQTDQYLSSQFAGFRINWAHDFFPARNENKIPSDKMTISSTYISKTKLYIKNPGFKAGDMVTIKVHDIDKPEITSECTFKIPKIK